MAHIGGGFVQPTAHDAARLVESRGSQIARCVACGADAWESHETWQGYLLATCGECGVTFTVNPDYTLDRYVAAYQGVSRGIPVPEKHAYIYTAPERRLMWEATAFPRLVPSPRLTPAEKLALRWLRAGAPDGTVIVDCGCGTGRFLECLTRAGLQAVGVELSELLVELLHQRGLRAVLGAAPDFPWEGPDPFAITFFEVLEHLPDPAAVMSPLRRRFPASHILASVPSPLRMHLFLKKRRGASDGPPNHYIRWTAAGFERLFRRLGYSHVRIIAPAPVGSEVVSGLGQIVLGERGLLARTGLRGAPDFPKADNNITLTKRAEATIALWVLKSYQVAADIFGFPLALHAKRHGGSAGSLFAIATP